MRINVEIDGQRYLVDIEDIQARPVVAVIEGERYEVWPELENQAETTTLISPEVISPKPAQPFASKGQGVSSGDSKNVTAPLPGVIVAILVKPGDTVSRGQDLCTLEAMKMKNAIKSNRDGMIASVAVNVGDQVNHGQLLLTYKE